MLFIVATPIGNLQDISLRALDVLKRADIIACEDTRHSGKLLRAHAITTPLMPYHEHNAEKQRPKILRMLGEGKHVALISDAGTPLISDPGFKLVEDARDAGLSVSPIPGACAAIAALSAAGLPSDRFLFCGFLPAKSAARRTALEEFRSLAATVMVYESPNRLVACLQDIASTLGSRKVVVARELTKQYEEFRNGSAAALAAAFESGEATAKGEIVLLIAPPDAHDDAENLSDDEIDAQLRHAMQHGSLKEAAAIVAEATGRPKREIYQRALALKDSR